ncbi:MAG: hypothetical protein AB9844_06745 [Clostridiaceae bacterium]
MYSNKIEIIYPLINEEEMINKIQRHNHFRRHKITNFHNGYFIYNPYFYYEFITKIKVFNRIREGLIIILIDGLTGMPVLVDKKIQFMTLNKEELVGTQSEFKIFEDEAKMIAIDNLRKVVYRKYCQFPEYKYQQRKMIFRKYFCINHEKNESLLFPFDDYEIR